MNLQWTFHRPQATLYHDGYISQALLDNTDASAAAQINDLYPYGGWKPFGKGQWKTNWTLKDGNMSDLPWIRYPGEPAMKPIASAIMSHPEAPSELLCVYQSDWWAIFQQDGSFEVCLLD